MEEAARALLDLGSKAVLLKGGHLAGDTLVDVLVSPQGLRKYKCQRLDTPHTHGTGCTLASAIAAGLAQGLALEPAVTRAWAYVQKALATAPGFGAGHGPLNHAHTVAPFDGA
jgi:hydroxymethylpyrimidine/phosphomethylpyrimidine kinase